MMEDNAGIPDHPDTEANLHDGGPPHEAPPATARPPIATQWLAVAAGVVAGLLAFGIGEATHGIIPAENVAHTMGGSKVMMPNQQTRITADTRNGALAYGVLGFCLAASLGVAGGVARRSNSGGVTGGVLGAVLGIAVGVGLSLALLPWFLSLRFTYYDYDLLISAGMHGLIWGLLGASAGLAFAVGLGAPRLIGLSLMAGLIGAVLGTIAYEALGASLFTMAKTGEVISESVTTRLLADLLVAAGVGLLVALWLPGSGDGTSARQEATT